jgi:phosphotransferase system  glucose/maltose/N-acetylglucosamine-specific IIC component
MKKQSLLKHPYKFAIIGGIFWGLTLFLATILSVLTGYGTAFLGLIGNIYPGYEISYAGSVNVLFFGFMDGFIICYLISFFIRTKRQRKDKKEEKK